jgi:hypothetical protein
VLADAAGRHAASTAIDTATASTLWV